MSPDPIISLVIIEQSDAPLRVSVIDAASRFDLYRLSQDVAPVVYAKGRPDRVYTATERFVRRLGLRIGAIADLSDVADVPALYRLLDLDCASASARAYVVCTNRLMHRYDTIDTRRVSPTLPARVTGVFYDPGKGQIARQVNLVVMRAVDHVMCDVPYYRPPSVSLLHFFSMGVPDSILCRALTGSDRVPLLRSDAEKLYTLGISTLAHGPKNLAFQLNPTHVAVWGK